MKYEFHDELLIHEGIEFDKNSPREILQYAIGGLLYMPATRTRVVQDIVKKRNPHIKSICLDLEDSVGDDTVEEAVIMLKSTLTKLHKHIEDGELSISELPLIFVRVRSPKQLGELKGILGAELIGVLTGFNLPKFDKSNAADYLREFDVIRNMVSTPIYINPILESKPIMYRQTRLVELNYIQRKLSGFSDNILNIRVGATDFCNIFGMRRKVHQSIYNIEVVADCFSDIINFFGKNYVVAGPVWEYFDSEGQDGPWKKGLINELASDKLNGFFGKTAIHPAQLPVIASSNIVLEEDYVDAVNILGMGGGLIGVAKGFGGNKMNEVKTHSHWARKIIAQASVYGISRKEM